MKWPLALEEFPSFSLLLLEVHESLALPTAVAKRETLTGYGYTVTEDLVVGLNRVCDGYKQGIDRV